MADVITGRCDACGRLSVSVPKSVGQVPVHYNHPSTGRPALGKTRFEVGYMDMDCYPRYPFGYGLSYTKFVLSDLVLSEDEMTTDGSIIITCQVKNVGERDGKTVVQLYIRDQVGSCVRPVKELKGFEKLALKAGEARVIRFTLRAEDLAFHNEKLEKVVEPGRFSLWVAQDSDDESNGKEFVVYRKKL